jgi:toxin CptA
MLAVQSCVHGLAALSLLSLELTWAARIALVAVVGVSFAVFLKRCRQTPISELHLGAKGELKVGVGETATILSETAILPGLILLSLRTDVGRLRLPLLADSLSQDDWRRLRVWLRWRAALG